MTSQKFVGMVCIALVLTTSINVYATSTDEMYNDLRSLILEYLGRSTDAADIPDDISVIKEYRIVMPLSLDEYRRGHLYSIAEFSKSETGGGEGVEIMANEAFAENSYADKGITGSGQYTYKVYHLKDKVPPFIRVLAPSGSLEVHEKSWNQFPYVKTELTNPYMKDNFVLQFETWHKTGRGEIENVHNIPQEKLNRRTVEFIDIVADRIDPRDYTEESDPTTCKSEVTGRGPLMPGQWKSEADPVMCSYKLVTMKFKWFGLQTKVELTTIKSIRRMLTNLHREMFCDLDKYINLTMDDIRKIEDETKNELDKLRNTGEVSGTRAK